MLYESESSENESHSVMSDSLWSHALYSPKNYLGQNTGVGSLSLFQGIFPSQGSNPGLPQCRQIFLLAEPQGKPKNTGVGSLSSRGSSQLGNWTGVSCIALVLYQLSYQGSPLTILIMLQLSFYTNEEKKKKKTEGGVQISMFTFAYYSGDGP